MNILLFISALLSGLLLSTPAYAQTADARVLSVTQGVAYTLGGKSEQLAVKMDVPLQAELKSDATGKAQLIFPDDSTLTIAPETVITLSDYSDIEDEENILLDLAAGTARIITGETNRKNPQAFTVNTPQASIGIRGTLVTIQVSGDLTRVYLTETSGQGVSVRNLHTGKVMELKKPGRIINVGPNFMEERKAQKEEAANFNAALRGKSRAEIGRASAQAQEMLRKGAVTSLAPEGTLPPAGASDPIQLAALDRSDMLTQPTLVADNTTAIVPNVPEVKPATPEVPAVTTPVLPEPAIEDFIITDVSQITNANFEGTGNFHLTYKLIINNDTYDGIRDENGPVEFNTRSASELDANSFGLNYNIIVPSLSAFMQGELTLWKRSWGDYDTGKLNLKLDGNFSVERTYQSEGYDYAYKIEGKFVSPSKVILNEIKGIKISDTPSSPSISNILNSPMELNRTN